MTENEVKAIVREIIMNYAENGEEKYCEALDTAVKALEGMQQYHAIGTPEECRTAREKQTAKRPDYEGDGYADGQLVYDTWICPCCGKRYEVEYDEYDYCPNCGQKLDWNRRAEDGKTD